ncbi:hypothetical protein [Limosilactobacillus fermentum]
MAARNDDDGPLTPASWSTRLIRTTPTKLSRHPTTSSATGRPMRPLPRGTQRQFDHRGGRPRKRL